MWSARSEELKKAGGLRFVLERDSQPATYSQVLTALCDDATFRALFTRTLADVPYSAFRWETPGVTLATADKPFEFVALDSPSLARRPDEQAFAEHFTKTETQAISFPNLGRNAILVVPAPLAEADAYGHLGAFVRRAPESQQQELWKLVGEAMKTRLSTQPVWLSTAGAGVSWLHVRLDDQPKYYAYMPYARTG